MLGKCYRCNHLGQQSNECPNKKPANVIEKDDEEICEPDGDNDTYEEYKEEEEHSSVI